jgi:hypothetical protein
MTFVARSNLAACRAGPPPRGGGWGGVGAWMSALVTGPLPVPPPQAGEGTLWRRIAKRQRDPGVRIGEVLS